MRDTLPRLLTVVMEDIDLPPMRELIKSMPIQLKKTLDLFLGKVSKCCVVITSIYYQLMMRCEGEFVGNNPYLPVRIALDTSDTIELLTFHLLPRTKRTRRLHPTGYIRSFCPSRSRDHPFFGDWILEEIKIGHTS